MQRTLPVLLAIVIATACAETANRQALPDPVEVTAEQFASLAWLEGEWRGSGRGVAPFYESYAFVDDSTIESRVYTDSTLTQVADSGRILFSGGALVSSGGGAEYVATRLSGSEVHFEPRANASNAFTWRRESESAWTATLQWQDESGEDRSRTYRMERIPGPPPP